MARIKKRTPQVEEVRAYVEGVAKNLADRLWGPNGPPWGTKLSTLEDLLVDIRELLSEKTLDLALQRQALVAEEQRPAEYQTCSGCGGHIPVAVDQPLEPRLVHTRAGEAQWQEPKHYCRTCRQAFFPSGQEPGR